MAQSTATFTKGNIWMDDGNILLLVGNANFKVHQSVLALHSEVFRDMFSIPGMEAESDHMDGLPLVRLSDDPREMGLFLAAMYDGIRFFVRDTPNFEKIIAVIRLGTKYEVPHLRLEGIRQLQPYLSYIAGGLTLASEKHWKPEYAIPLANLSDELDLLDILPTALYGCSQLGTSIIDGMEHEDRIQERLSSLNLKRCLMARGKLVVMQSSAMTDAHFCIASCSCDRQLQGGDEQCLGKALFVETQPFRQDVNVWDPLRRLAVWWREMSSLSLCKTCLSTASSFYNDSRMKIWKELPEVFSLIPPSPTKGQVNSVGLLLEATTRALQEEQCIEDYVGILSH